MVLATVDWSGAGGWIYLLSVGKKRNLRRSASKLVTKGTETGRGCDGGNYPGVCVLYPLLV